MNCTIDILESCLLFSGAHICSYLDESEFAIQHFVCVISLLLLHLIAAVSNENKAKGGDGDKK
jgi:hypothetical protein